MMYFDFTQLFINFIFLSLFAPNAAQCHRSHTIVFKMAAFITIYAILHTIPFLANIVIYLMIAIRKIHLIPCPDGVFFQYRPCGLRLRLVFVLSVLRQCKHLQTSSPLLRTTTPADSLRVTTRAATEPKATMTNMASVSKIPWKYSS